MLILPEFRLEYAKIQEVPISTGYNELIIAGIQKGKTQKTEIEEEV
jgi:hypothetical protein